MQCRSYKLLGVLTILVVFGALASAEEGGFCPSPANEMSVTPAVPETVNPLNADARGAYDANIRVYVTEIASRWYDSDGYKYHYAMLDVPLNIDVLMGYQEEYHDTLNWNSVSEGWGVINDNNIQVFAAVYDNVPVLVNGDPAYHNPFMSKLAVASASATPFESWPDAAADHFTHNVFCEEITATW